MAKLIASGVWAGRPVHVTWEDGQLSTDPEHIKGLLEHIADFRAGDAIGVPAGPVLTEGYFSDPWVTVALLGEYFDEIRDVAVEGMERLPPERTGL